MLTLARNRVMLDVIDMAPSERRRTAPRVRLAKDPLDVFSPWSNLSEDPGDFSVGNRAEIACKCVRMILVIYYQAHLESLSFDSKVWIGL